MNDYEFLESVLTVKQWQKFCYRNGLHVDSVRDRAIAEGLELGVIVLKQYVGSSLKGAVALDKMKSVLKERKKMAVASHAARKKP